MAPPSTDLTCVNPTTAGAAVTCSLTLSQTAGLKAVVTDHQTCEAHGDTFIVTAPTADTLSTDGCFETVGKEIDLAGPYQSGTSITLELKPGLLVTGAAGLAAVRVDGQYPQWTVNFEDAAGAFPGETDDYNDLIVTVTVVPTSGQ